MAGVGGGSNYLTGFKDADKDVLVKIVKLSQGRKTRGRKGDWKQYVAGVNRKRGGSDNDPAKHPVDVLASFVQTFTKPEDIDMVKRARKWARRTENLKLLGDTQPGPKSPEQVCAILDTKERMTKLRKEISIQELVRLTQAHPLFQQLYNFPSYHEGWKISKRAKEGSNPERLVSLGCEVVESAGRHTDIVRICAVNRDCKVLINQLVLPATNIGDCITSITEVKAKDLEQVAVTQAAAQKLVKKLLTPGTILVGHSLNHALAALKIDHKQVIDTALLFHNSGSRTGPLPTLITLCKAVWKTGFQKEGLNSCMDDAILPMRLVLYRLQHDASSCVVPCLDKGYSCNGLLPLPQMIAMNTEERSRTFPSLVSTQTAVTGAVILGSKPWISSKETNEDNGKAVMDSSKYLTGFKETDMNVLIMIVRTALAQQIKGQMGGWLEFVSSVNAKSGGSETDPASHRFDVLAAFVKTFTNDEDIQTVKRIRKWAHSHKLEELLNATQPWPKTPEQELVELSRAHIRFPCSYTFPSYQKGWIISKQERKINVPERIISLDCEMVDCEGGEAQIVKICAVDRNCDVLIDELVLPNKKVVDYLTHITGVKAEDLEGVSLTQEAVQRMVKKILSPGTILVGHSLDHDLSVLKIDHRRVIDTAFIFQPKTWALTHLPSLVNLCKAVLRYDFREEGKPHNCLDDAIVPMRLVLHRLEHGLEEYDITQSKRVKKDSVSKLFLHKLPNFLTVTDLQTLFTAEFPCEIQEITVKSQHKTGSTYAVFRSREEADSAFEQLQGLHAVDSFGFPQKTVAMTVRTPDNSSKRAEIQVRKMVNFTTPIVKLQNRDFGDASLMNSMIDTSRKRLLPGNEDESRVAKRGKFEELPGAVNYGALSLPTGVHMLQGGGFGGFQSFGGVPNTVIPTGILPSGYQVLCPCGHFQELHCAKLELAKAHVELQLRNIEVNRLQQLVTALSHRERLS